jgi:prophage regulatory protein
MTQTLLRRPDVQARTGLSRSRLYELMDAGDFPKPVPLSQRARAWVEAEVQAWIVARIAERDRRTKAA